VSSILPEGETVRRAVRWISEQRREHPGRSTAELIDEAGRRFDLSPLEQLGLTRLLRDRPPPTGER